jgi:hypothetical protein
MAVARFLHLTLTTTGLMNDKHYQMIARTTIRASKSRFTIHNQLLPVRAFSCLIVLRNTINKAPPNIG